MKTFGNKQPGCINLFLVYVISFLANDFYDPLEEKGEDRTFDFAFIPGMLEKKPWGLGDRELALIPLKR